MRLLRFIIKIVVFPVMLIVTLIHGLEFCYRLLFHQLQLTCRIVLAGDDSVIPDGAVHRSRGSEDGHCRIC